MNLKIEGCKKGQEYQELFSFSALVEWLNQMTPVQEGQGLIPVRA